MRADRDRWKARCEAAENVIFCADGYCTTDDYYNAFDLWDKLAWYRGKTKAESDLSDYEY